MKREIYKQGYDPDTNFRLINPPSIASGVAAESEMALSSAAQTSGFEDTYLYFDSTQSGGDSNYSGGEVKWSITTLNNNVDIRNCVAIRVGQFYFPKIYNPTTAPDYFYFLRVFVEILNIPASQSILGPKGNKFHFEFEVQNPTGQAVLLVPVNDTFYFRRPILSLTDLQLRFTIPPNTSSLSDFIRISIPNDVVSLQSLVTGGIGFNPIRFQIMGLDTTAVLGLIGSLGSPGVAVFITGYASNSTAVNTAVNNIQGIYATTVLSASTFEIAGIDATTVVGQFSAIMYIPKNRFAFPVRFTSVVNQITNYLDVSHD